MKNNFYKTICNFIIFIMVVIFAVSCQKQDELKLEEKRTSPSEQDSRLLIPDSEREKIKQDFVKLLADEVSIVEPEANLKHASPQPAVSFTSSWNSNQYKYNCEAEHNLVLFIGLPPYGWGYAGTNYVFAAYYNTTGTGTFNLGNEIPFEVLEDDHNIEFNINNPPSPGRYYFVKCLWQNIFMNAFTGEIALSDVYEVNSSVEYFAYHAPPPPPFSVDISGPVKGWNNQYYTWSATPSNGTAPITYLWYRSNDGGQTYTQGWGSGQHRTEMLPDGQDLYIKVIATAANGTATDIFDTMNMGNKP